MWNTKCSHDGLAVNLFSLFILFILFKVKRDHLALWSPGTKCTITLTSRNYTVKGSKVKFMRLITWRVLGKYTIKTSGLPTNIRLGEYVKRFNVRVKRFQQLDAIWAGAYRFVHRNFIFFVIMLHCVVRKSWISTVDLLLHPFRSLPTPIRASCRK